MELHNTAEDVIIARVEDIFNTIEKEGNPANYCICAQCRMDTVCYVLNRTLPYYIVSNRGAARVQQENFENQQKLADITALVYEGIRQVNHNQRPNFTHSGALSAGAGHQGNPVFNVPTIVGRLFDGGNFSPLSGINVELLRNGKLVLMKDGNWQNPCTLVPNTEGMFTFWPVSIPADAVDEHKVFEYSIKVRASQFDTLIHFFKIAAISEIQTTGSFAMNRTFKLPDLYMFPPGEAEKNGYLD
jgi:competence protein ComFB